MLQIGDRFGQGLACKVVGEGLGTFGGITKAPLGLWLRQAAALPEFLRVRMRTERSPNSLAFVHTLCTVRKEKSTYIRLYKMFCHPNDLSRSQVWSPSR